MLPLALLVFYPGAPERLGRGFLPIVLSYVTCITLVEHGVILDWVLKQPQLRPYFDSTITALPFFDGSWALFVMLLIPLVFISWQYDFRRVLFFSVGVAILEALLLGAVLHLNGLPTWQTAFSAIGQAIIFVLVGYILTRMMDAQRTQRRELAAHAAMVEQLTVSRERNRMARELHDTLAHSLSAVSVQLEAVDSALDTAPDTARLLLAKALAQTRSGLTETRRAMQSLRASPLEDLGLALAIESLAKSTARRAGLTAEIEIDENLPSLPPAIEQGVYRVAQEALSNVTRHANATTLHVILRGGDNLQLMIHDNGRGFSVEPAGENGHYGMVGMSERAAMMGANLDVESAPGLGTTVKLVLP
jgi:signal transduction histidine kinase